MKDKKGKPFVKTILYACILITVTMLTFMGIKVIPHGVSYTVKEEQTSVKAQAQEKEPIVYTVKSVGNRICVFVGSRVLYELNVRTEDISEYDRQRLRNGIVITDEFELYTMKEHLES